MQTPCISEIKSWLKANLSEERYIHTLGVAEAAVELAQMYGLDVEKAEIAGLLHDCAKCKPNDELLNIIKTEIKTVNESELMNYKTLHAPVGAHFAENIFGVEDSEILSAIRYHTLGKVDMSDFEMIIFLADKIEARTRDLTYRNEILAILNANEGVKGLHLALFKCFKETIKSLVDRELHICFVTIEVYNSLLSKIKAL